MASRADALKALQTSIDGYQTARGKLEQLIARKKFAGKDVTKERNEKASLSRKIGNADDLSVEIEAAQTVVSAPTQSEINAVSDQIATLRDMAVKDAALAAGFSFIKKVVASADDLRRKTKPA